MSEHLQSSEFIRLLTNHQTALRGLIVAMLPGSQDVNDILQDTNIVLWEKMNSYAPDTNFKAWAYSVARYRVMQYRAKQRKLGKLILNESLLTSIEDSYSSHETPETLDERAVVLRQCLSKLSKKEQHLIRDRYAVETTMQRYAEKIGMPYGSMRVTIYRIKQKLRSCISKRLSMKGGPA